MLDDDLKECVSLKSGRSGLWCEFLRRKRVRTFAEVGVYRGQFAEKVLRGCPEIREYVMIDPWRNLSDWNKPANRANDEFEEIYREAMARTEFAADRRRVLRGTTVEVADEIPDGSLDFCYIDGDHTLRGITIDLIRMFPKVREGGWIGGDDFTPSVWQHSLRYEPTFVFPFAVHFAAAQDLPIAALPGHQFLIARQPGAGHEFIDTTGRYPGTEVRPQVTLGRLLRRWVTERLAGLPFRRKSRGG